MAAKLRHTASSFTYNGQYFALLSVDGRLRIWETVSGKLLQEFTPSAHLETTCTCLCWTKLNSRRDRNRKKKKRKQIGEDEQNDNLDESEYPNVALGSHNGKIFIFNPIIGGLSHTLDDGHKKIMNGIVYDEKNDFIYSCSSDCNIVEWNASSNKFESAWKADETSVEIITLPPGNDVILSAGKLIKMWDLNTKDLLQTFNGHFSSISLLEFSLFKNAGSGTLDVDGRYFVSGSTNDRLINVWHVNTETPNKQAIASYLLSDIPACMDLFTQLKSEKPIKLSVACQDGSIHFFENALNGECKTPIPNAKKMMFTSGDNPTSFIKMRLSEDLHLEDFKIDLVSGSNFKPRFDAYRYSELDISTCVKHDTQNNMLMAQNHIAIPKTDIAVQDKNTTQVTSAKTLTVSAHTSSDATKEIENSSKKAKKANEKKRLSRDDVGNYAGKTLGDLVEKSERKRKWTKDPLESGTSAMSFSTMVAQALHSKDRVLLSRILSNQSTEVIEATVKRLTAPTAGNLFGYLVNDICVRHEKSYTTLPWLRTIMANNMGYMSSNAKTYDLLARLFNFLKAKTDFYPKLHRLEGKINFLVNQINQVTKEDSSPEICHCAIVYHEESDEDEMDFMFNIRDEGESSAGDWNPSDDEDDEEDVKKAKKVNDDLKDSHILLADVTVEHAKECKDINDHAIDNSLSAKTDDEIDEDDVDEGVETDSRDDSEDDENGYDGL